MEKKEFVQSAFDNIAYKYDFLNHLLSLNIDKYWRKKAIKLTNIKPNALLLDVACGTGDFSIEAQKNIPLNVFGADFSYQMLKHYKLKDLRISGKLVQMAAEYLPLKDSIVDNIIVAFGVRNFYNISLGFNNFHRILKTGGKVTILEFGLPKNKVLGSLYKFYFKNILPFLGGLISGNFKAYKYLPDSVEEFDEKVDLVALLKEAGFNKIEKHLLTFGVVQIVIAEK